MTMRHLYAALIALAAISLIGASCPGPKPSPAPATPTIAPTVAPPATPAPPPTMVPISGTCSPASASFSIAVRVAQLATESTHPDWMVPKFVRRVAPSHWLDYDYDVADRLRKAGNDAVVDACNCSVVAVARRFDQTSHDDYALLVSSGDVRDPFSGGYRDTCRPRGFPCLECGAPTTVPVPPTIAPTGGPLSCPPMTMIGCKTLGAPRFEGGQNVQDIDCTPRFDINGPGCTNSVGGCPCSADKPTCGVALGDTCESPEDTLVVDSSPNVRKVGNIHYRWRAYGNPKKPKPFHLTVAPGNLDKSGRVIDASKFAQSTLSGTI